MHTLMLLNSHRAPVAVSFSFHQHSQSHYQVFRTAAAGRGGWAWRPVDLVTLAPKPRPPQKDSAYAVAVVGAVPAAAAVIWLRLLVPSAV